MAAMYFFNNMIYLPEVSIMICLLLYAQGLIIVLKIDCLGFRFTSLKTLSTSPAEQFNELGYSLETCKNFDEILQNFLS